MNLSNYRILVPKNDRCNQQCRFPLLSWSQCVERVFHVGCPSFRNSSRAQEVIEIEFLRGCERQIALPCLIVVFTLRSTLAFYDDRRAADQNLYEKIIFQELNHEAHF